MVTRRPDLNHELQYWEYRPIHNFNGFSPLCYGFCNQIQMYMLTTEVLFR